MKSFKKSVAMLLCFVMLFTSAVFTGGAQSAYLESEHPYKNDSTELYVYTYPEEVDALFVTFDAQTSFEKAGWDFAPEDFDPSWSFSELMSHYKRGDGIIIYTNYVEEKMDYDAYLEDIYYWNYNSDRGVAFNYDSELYFGGTELAGKTVYVPGNVLAIELSTDASITDYGFSVEHVGAQIPEGKTYVHYNIGESSYYDFFGVSGELSVNSRELPEYGFNPGFALEGWAAQPGGEVAYKNDGVIKNDGENIELYPVWTREYCSVTYVLSDESFVDTYIIDEEKMETSLEYPSYLGINPMLLTGWSEQPGATVAEYASYGEELEQGRDYVLYPVWRETSLQRSETFSFEHEYYNFPDGYALNKAHYENLVKNVALTFGLNPVALVALLARHRSNNKSEAWGGSCNGMAVATALQHEGYIDLLSEQNASCVSELKPTQELISTINYYQSLTVESSFAERLSVVISESAFFRQSIKNLYESAASGKISMFNYILGNVQDVEVSDIWQSVGHSVLAVGAFELPEEYRDDVYTRAIIVYNCNNTYSYELLYVADDWSSIYYDSNDGGEILVFRWTDDFTYFKAFDINGDSEPLSWYRAVINRIIDFFKTLFASIKFIF